MTNSKVSLKQLHDEGYNIFMDSGAYSFAVSKKAKSTDLDTYFEKYLDYCIQNKDYIEMCVELDIDILIGTEKVEQWRDIMFDKGLNPIVVWHPIRGWEKWVQHCKDYDYVGFNTINDFKSIRQIAPFMDISEKHDTKVHGFGTTKPDMMATMPFYSVDSTSWLAGGKYGNFYYFNGKGLDSYTPDKFAQKFDKSFNQLDNKQTHLWNLQQWYKFSKHMEDR